MGKFIKMKNVFADKATFIARKMLLNNEKRWVVRDFVGAQGVSLGMAQGVLETMAKKGYVERNKKGPDSYTILTNRDKLIFDWLKEYKFELNEVDTYYSPDIHILKKIKERLNEDQYVLTLHAGANLITSFVLTGEIHLYISLEDWERDVREIRQKLQLKKLARGGNIHLIRPFYKNSVFFNKQKIRGYPVVSNLELYLDLYNYMPRGREHAEYLKKILEEKGKRLD